MYKIYSSLTVIQKKTSAKRESLYLIHRNDKLAPPKNISKGPSLTYPIGDQFPPMLLY